jgi:hypothetical protein
MVVGKEKNEDWAEAKERMGGIKAVMDGGGREKGLSGYGEKGERWSRKCRDNNTVVSLV